MEAWREELYHHGVKGMHWGIRRYQPYPSGSSGRFLGKKKSIANTMSKNGDSKRTNKSRYVNETSEEKQRRVSEGLANAKKNDIWSLDFLELTPDDNTWSEQKMLSEYKKYLEDPDEYMRKR